VPGLLHDRAEAREQPPPVALLAARTHGGLAPVTTEQTERLLALLERIADAVAPTPEQVAARYEEEEYLHSRRSLKSIKRQSDYIRTRPVMTNAIAGEAGRGVR
jgi:hypothetical protein